MLDHVLAAAPGVGVIMRKVTSVVMLTIVQSVNCGVIGHLKELIEAWEKGKRVCPSHARALWTGHILLHRSTNNSV